MWEFAEVLPDERFEPVDYVRTQWGIILAAPAEPAQDGAILLLPCIPSCEWARLPVAQNLGGVVGKNVVKVTVDGIDSSLREGCGAVGEKPHTGEIVVAKHQPDHVTLVGVRSARRASVDQQVSDVRIFLRQYALHSLTDRGGAVEYSGDDLDCQRTCLN